MLYLMLILTDKNILQKEAHLRAAFGMLFASRAYTNRVILIICRGWRGRALPDSKNMRIKGIHIAIFTLLSFFLASCGSSVRFSQSGERPYSRPESVSGRIDRKGKPSGRNEDPGTGKLPEVREKGRRGEIIAEAETWLGAPYVYGGEAKDGVDCSGFVMEVYSAVGIKIARTATSQYLQSEKIPKENCRAGDLIFFGNSGKISHVGIFVGENKMIHASSSRGVIVSSLDESYYLNNYAGAGRVLGK